MRFPKHPKSAGVFPHSPTRCAISRLLQFLALCTLAASLAACGDDEPVVLGFAGQLDGVYSDLGVQGRNGAMLAVEQANAEGGIHGRPVRLIAENDANTPQGARQAILNLHAQGAAAVIGHMTSSQTLAGYPEAERLGMLMISPTTSSPLFSGKDDLFFRVIQENVAWVKTLARHAYGQDGIRTVVQITDMRNAAFTEPNNELFADVFTRQGGTITANIRIPAESNPSWDAISDKVARLAPDAVQVALSARDLAALSRRLRLKAPKVRIYSSMWAYTEDILQVGGKAVEGIIFTVAYAGDNKSPEFLKFQDTYQKRFGRQANFAAALGYECATLLIETIRRVGFDPAQQAKSLIAMEGFRGVLGPLDFDEFGDVRRAAFIVTIKDRKFVTISTLKDEQ